MTIPWLMNCPHQEDGWCLNCVSTLGNTAFLLKEALMLAGKHCEHLHHPPLMQHGWDKHCPVEERIEYALNQPFTTGDRHE